MTDDGAVFKGSGSFHVDRERALEKLSLYGMTKTEFFFLPLIRCAAAAGADHLRVDSAGGFTVRFDGRPFAPDELKDPYGGLFAESPDPRLQQLALGLLSCLRLGPKKVTIETGEGPARLRLTALSLREDSVAPAPSDEKETVVRVEWGLWRSFGWKYPVRAARGECPLTPPGFRLDGVVSRLPARPAHQSAEFAEGALRGLLHLPEPGVPHSVVTLCSFGVAVETMKTWLPWAQVRAWVNDDGFALNASQSAVVLDERRNAALDALAAASARFLEDAAAALEDPRGRPELEALIPWMQEAAGRLLNNPAADDTRPLLKCLWDAPLFLDSAHEPLSLRTLADEKAARGYVAWSRADCPGAAPAERVAWCPDESSKACLKARFGGELRDLSELIESLARAK